VDVVICGFVVLGAIVVLLLFADADRGLWTFGNIDWLSKDVGINCSVHTFLS
jgi:hypothetical protein